MRHINAFDERRTLYSAPFEACGAVELTVAAIELHGAGTRVAGADRGDIECVAARGHLRMDGAKVGRDGGEGIRGGARSRHEAACIEVLRLQ
jgi:hypothetical protein